VSSSDEPGSDRGPTGEVLGPLPLWACSAVVGALVGERLPAAGPHAMVLTVAAVVACTALGVAALRSEAAGRGVLAAVAVALVAASGAASRGAASELSHLAHLAAHGGRASITATVVQEPRPIATGWNVVLRVDRLDGVAVRDRAVATLDGPPPSLGSRWTGTVSARPLPDGGYGRWLARQHAVVLVDPVTWEPAAGPGPLAASSEHVRERVRQAATRHLDDRTGGLLVGFVTGDVRLLPERDQEAMRDTGLSHLTAVSGSNVAVVVGGVLGVAALLRVGASGRRRVVLVAVAWFAFLTRFEPSVLRAGTMTVLLLLAGARGVAGDARHALASAVLVLVLIDPLLAGSLGLLLSATATAGVLVVAPRVRARLPTRLPARLAEVLAITLGAQVAVVPILLATFGEVRLASVPANLVAVPAAGLAAVLAFVGSVVALVSPVLGGAVLAVAGVPAGVVLAAAHGFQDLGGVVDVGRPVTVIALMAACLALLARPGGRAGPRLLAATVALTLLVTTPLLTARSPVRELTVTAIDVGQGDAFLVESPAARVLVDAGEDDAAARWLRSAGRRHLDLVVVTHPHLDHVGGIPDVLRRLHVDAVWYRPLPTELPQAQEVLEVALGRDVPVRVVASGDRARVGDLDVEVLGPPPGRPYRFERSEPNDTSIVVRISHEGRRVLLAGDAERAAQADLLTAPRYLEAELIAVPHHGSHTTDPAFLAATGAQVALISAGRDNRHGHPHEKILAVLGELGMEVRRTDQEGTVRVAVPLPDRQGASVGSVP
jgi:competence protein ComEC